MIENFQEVLKARWNGRRERDLAAYAKLISRIKDCGIYPEEPTITDLLPLMERLRLTPEDVARDVRA